MGLVFAYGPAFSGASDYSVSVTPAGFLRYGRFTVTGAGGFTTKRREEVDRGLGAELVERDDLRVSVGLRYDNGREDSESDELAGMGDIPGTLRGRLAVRWEPVPDWRLTAGFGVDLLDRVGGFLADVSLSREWRLSQGQTWRMSAGVSGASSRYMQAWYGVTPEQSVASGYPVYDAPAGLREMNIAGIWRVEFAHRWAGFVGAGYSRLLGAAADSPLARRLDGYGVSASVAWRF